MHFFKQDLKCPQCGATIKLNHDMDWDSLVMQVYPQCKKCGFTTKQGFDTEQQAVDFLKFYKKFEVIK